jgi:hypothetical protein
MAVESAAATSFFADGREVSRTHTNGEEKKMKLHIASTVAVGLALAAGVASAQTDTTHRTTSTTRIPITKESPGEVALPRVDTVTVYRVDTLSNYRVDTVTITRVDTVNVTPPPVTTSTVMPAMLRQIGGFYLGFDGGAAVPSGTELNTVQGTGWHVDVPFGWDPVGSILGVRVAAGYSHFGMRNGFSGFNTSNAQIWDGDADLKLRLPVKQEWAHRFQIYGLGGASWNYYRNIVEFNGVDFVSNNSGVGVASATFPVAQDDSWNSHWGWNAGGGLQFGVGRTNLFVESRYVRFSGVSGDLSQVPIVVGVNWY